MRPFTILAIGISTACLGAAAGSAQDHRAPAGERGQEVRQIVRAEIRRALEEAREEIHEAIRLALRAHGSEGRLPVTPHGGQPGALHLGLTSQPTSPEGAGKAGNECCCCCCCKREATPDQKSGQAKPKGKVGLVVPPVRPHLPPVPQLQGLSLMKPISLPAVRLEMMPARRATTPLRIELVPALDERVERADRNEQPAPKRKLVRRKIQI